MPGGTYFLYAPAPKGGRRPHVRQRRGGVSQYLITRAVDRACVPWDDAGAYLRFSVTYEATDERAEDALMATAEERLRAIRPVF